MRETQTTFWDDPEPIGHHGYPMSKPAQVEAKTLARRDGPETSKQAAKDFVAKLNAQEELVLRWLKDWHEEKPDFPPTTWELAAHADPTYTGNYRANVNMIERIISRRMSGLVDKGWVKSREHEVRENMTEHSSAKMKTWRLIK